MASTSLVYAIDPNASAALQNAKKQAAAKAQNTQERITRIEDQIARMEEELIALREQKIQAQRETFIPTGETTASSRKLAG